MGSIRIAFGCVLLVAGCKEPRVGALETFAKKYSCPEAQVTVKSRTDLDAATEMSPNFETKPSDEVKNDPARFAKWTQDQEKVHATWAAGFSGYEMFQVTGCGHDIIYACHHPNGTRGSYRPEQVSCEESRKEYDREHDAAKAAKKQAKEDAKAAKRAAKDGVSATPSDP